MHTASFAPKLLTVLREGYRLANFRADAMSGLTVAIVALPLSMAIAIASHATPAAGLVSAVVGGFLISALGGSRYQIGGPAGAFIVLVASIIDQFGFDGLMLATMMAGGLMVLGSLLRLGSLVRLVPHPVIVGFSSGIAVIIFISQIKELFGVELLGAEPAALFPKLAALWSAAETWHWQAAALAAICISTIAAIRVRRPNWPAFLIAVALCSSLAAVFGFDASTIGTRFGELPHGLPAPRLPDYDSNLLLTLFPSAISLALLGSIESLLSAMVADNMKGRKHRSNAELLAQGIANIVTPLFGGITVTGTIARTATNVRAGAHGPMSGIMHALFLIMFMMIAAPLASFIPLSALAGILVVVCWNMFERNEVRHMLRHWPSGLVFAVTFLVTIIEDLLIGIVAGTVLYYVLSHFFRTSGLDRQP